MIAALIASTVILWAVLIVLALTVVALLRQVGMLHERLGPVGALTLPGGPRAGDMAPVFELEALDGDLVRIGGAGRSMAMLLFFISPICPVCKTLIPVAKSIAREYDGRLQLVFASDGDVSAQAKLVRDLKLEAFPLVLSTDLGLAFQISKLPHAILIDTYGKVVARGLVNNREHLESLFEAWAMGVASLQEFRKMQTGYVAR